MISNWQGTLPCVVIHTYILKPCHINIGKVENGELVTVSTLRDLFKHIQERKKDNVS